MYTIHRLIEYTHMNKEHRLLIKVYLALAILGFALGSLLWAIKHSI